MKFQRVHKSTSQSSQRPQETSKLTPRPFSIQSKETSGKPPTQAEIENQAFQNQKMEVTKLEIQAKYGTITPEGRERLGVLQAKMNDFWVQRKQSSGQPNLLEIPGLFTRRETRLAQQIQPQLTIGQPGDKYEQEADKIAADVVNAIHQNQSTLQRQNGEQQEQINTHTTELVQHNQTNMNAAALSLQGNIVQCKYLNPGEYNSWLKETQAQAKVGKKGFRLRKSASRDALKAIDNRLFYFVHSPSNKGDKQENLQERISLLKGIKQAIKSSRYLTEDKKTEIFLFRQKAVNSLLSEVGTMLAQLKSELIHDNKENEEDKINFDKKSLSDKSSQYSDKLEESKEDKKTAQQEEKPDEDAEFQPEEQEDNGYIEAQQQEEKPDDDAEFQPEEQEDNGYIEAQQQEEKPDDDAEFQPEEQEDNGYIEAQQQEEKPDDDAEFQPEEQEDNGYIEAQQEEKPDDDAEFQPEEQEDNGYIEAQQQEANGYVEYRQEKQENKDYFNTKSSKKLENEFEEEDGKVEILETKSQKPKKIDDNQFKDNKKLGVYGKRKAFNHKKEQENQGEVKDENGKIIGQMQNWHPAYKGKAIRHLDQEDRKAKKLKIQNGKLYGHDSESKEQNKEDENKFVWKGKPYKTKEMKSLWGSSSDKAIFVMTVNGKIYAADQAAEYQKGLNPHQKQQWIFHHSSFVAGAEVATAGEIEIKDGVLQGITDASGHYYPNAAMTRQVLQMLQDGGVSLKGVYVQITIPQHNSNLIYPADKFLKHTTAEQEPQEIIEKLQDKQDEDTSILSESAELAKNAGNLIREAKYLSKLFLDMDDLLKPGQKEKIEIRMKNLYELALRKGWKAYKAGLTNQNIPDNDYLEAYISFEAAKEIESFNDCKDVEFKKPDDVPQNAEAFLKTMGTINIGGMNALDKMQRLAREKNML